MTKSADRCSLIVTRPSQLLGKARNYRIFVDNKIMGVIGNGETLQMDVLPGHHVIQWDIEEHTSARLLLGVKGIQSDPLTVQLEPGTRVKLSCQNKPGLWKPKAFLQQE